MIVTRDHEDEDMARLAHVDDGIQNGKIEQAWERSEEDRQRCGRKRKKRKVEDRAKRVIK